MIGEKIARKEVSMLSNKKIRTFLTVLLPSFLLPIINGSQSARGHVAPTAWLDGMRGIAAFFVFLRHYEFAYHRKGNFIYGTVDDPNFPDSNKSLLQLPILRLINNGDAMVCIFFIISGYALSLKSLKLIRRSAHDQLLRVLASSIIRRPFRLFLPCIASTFMIFIALRIGIFNYPNRIAEDEETFRAVFLGWAHERQPHIFNTTTMQAWDYYENSKGLFDIFTHEHWPAHGYDIHLWTIPVEFRCSLILFLTIAGLSIVRARIRLITLGIMIAGSFQCDVWELGLFWGGMLLAELHLIQQENLDLNGKIEEGIPLFNEEDDADRRFNRKILCYFGFFVGLVLLSFPFQRAEFAPFWSSLYKWVPSGLRLDERYRFWQCIGALLLVWVTNNETSLQKPFASAIGRYLGNISYALYLVHGFVNKTVGYSVVYNLWAYVTGWETNMQYETGFALGGIVVIAVTIWLADLFWRFVDMPIVRFARWVETKVTAPADDFRGTRNGGA